MGHLPWLLPALHTFILMTTSWWLSSSSLCKKQNWVSEKSGNLAVVTQPESGMLGPRLRSDFTNTFSCPVWWKDTTSLRRVSCNSSRYNPSIPLSFCPQRYRPSVAEWAEHWFRLRQTWVRTFATFVMVLWLWPSYSTTLSWFPRIVPHILI